MLCNLIPIIEIVSIFTVIFRDDRKSVFDLICSTKVVEYKTQKNLIIKSVLSIILPYIMLAILAYTGLLYLANTQSKSNITPIQKDEATQTYNISYLNQSTQLSIN